MLSALRHVSSTNPDTCCRAWLTRWKVLWESTNPRESVFVTNTWQHLPHLLFCGPLVPNFPTEQFCKQLPVFINNRWFTEFFDCYLHIPPPIVTKHELGLPFPPCNLPIKFGTNPSTICLVILVIDIHTQTHKPTLVKTYSVAFVGIKMYGNMCTDYGSELSTVLVVAV